MPQTISNILFIEFFISIYSLLNSHFISSAINLLTLFNTLPQSLA